MPRNVFRPSLSEARKLISSAEFVSDVYFNGYQWLKAHFIPALQRLSTARHRTDRVLASGGYYLLGDVHDINDAPRAAIRSYRQSVRLWPKHGAAYREMAGMYEQMGERDRALRLFRKAIRVDPSDPLAQDDLDLCEKYPITIYKAGDPYWESCESVASGRFKVALTVLEGKRSLTAHKHRARVYGAMGNSETALGEWRAVTHGTQGFEIESADWFFLPVSMWTDPTFWQLLWRARARILNWGVVKGQDDLRQLELTGKRRFLDLFLRFHLAKTKRDLSSARRLRQKYPEWTDAEQLVKSLPTQHGRMISARSPSSNVQ